MSVPARFPLAPMSSPVRVVTVALLAIAAALVLAGLAGERALLVPGVVLSGIEAAVWSWSRPVAFAVGGTALRLHYPLRHRDVPLQDVSGVRAIEARAFRAEFGFPLRVGVGGLWGGFGWLWTARRGWVDFAVSGAEDLVLVERRRARPLLVTPERPAEFIRVLRAAIAPREPGR